MVVIELVSVGSSCVAAFPGFDHNVGVMWRLAYLHTSEGRKPF